MEIRHLQRATGLTPNQIKRWIWDKRRRRTADKTTIRRQQRQLEDFYQACINPSKIQLNQFKKKTLLSKKQIKEWFAQRRLFDI